MKKYYTLSPKQKEDWFYNSSLKEEFLPNVMEITVELEHINVPAFSAAFETLIVHNESLRTSFPVVNKELVQQVEDYSDKFALVHLEESFTDKPEEILRSRLFEMKDISTAPLIKGFLYKRINSNYVVYILIHHIISDFWSVNLIKKQLVEYYQGKMRNLPVDHSIKKVQLGEYLALNHDLYHTGHDKVIEEWRSRLMGLKWQIDFDIIYENLRTAILEEAFDRSMFKWKGLRGTDLIANPVGETYICFIDEKLNGHVKAYKNNFKRSTNGIILACLNILGFRLAGNKEVLIQTHYINRNDEVSYTIIGNLLGKVLLLNAVDDEQTVSNLMDQCNFSFYDATSKVIFNSEGLEHLDLTTRCFLFYNFISKEMSGGKMIKVEEAVFKPDVWVESPLVCQIFEYENCMVLKWSYHLSFFNRATIEYISAAFERILAQIVTQRVVYVKNIVLI